jgi:hypothetical protein
MATRNHNGPQENHASEIPEEEDPEGEIEETDEDEEDAFDEANDTAAPEPEPINSDPRENLSAAVEHIERAVRKLGGAYSSSLVLRLALHGQNANQDCEIVDCLNRHVTTEIGRIIYRLIRAARRLGADIENPMEPRARRARSCPPSEPRSARC